MIVYSSWPSEMTEWVMPVEKGGHRIIKDVLFSDPGVPVGGRWVPQRMYMLTEDDNGESLQQTDMPHYGADALVVNKRARDSLEPVIGQDAEFLEITGGREDLWLVNPWRVLDVFDEERSDFKRFNNSRRIMKITKYAFRPGLLEGVTCFRIPQRLGEALWTDLVVEAIGTAGLTGTVFRKVWADLPEGYLSHACNDSSAVSAAMSAA
jgi:hypothetical protein